MKRSIPAALLLAACGGAVSVTPAAIPAAPVASVAPRGLSSEAIGEALVERFETAHCEADFCLDPFPLWAVTGMAVADDRIALAGPGGLLSVWDGRWRTFTAPTEGAEDPDQVAVHGVAFTPAGTLVAVGAEGRIWTLEDDGLVLLRQLPADAEDPEWGRTLIDVIAPSAEALWVLSAEGLLHRLAGDEDTVARFEGAFDRLVPTGEPLERSVVLTGPFGGYLVRGALGPEPDVETFLTDAQLDVLGDYSGCGRANFDERADEVEALAGELMDGDGLSYEEALELAEAQTPPRTENLPPAGLDVPRSGWPREELLEALAASEAGRAIVPMAHTAPAGDHVARDGDAVVVAGTDGRGQLTVWARFARGGATHEGPAEGAVRAVAIDGRRAVVIGARGGVVVVTPSPSPTSGDVLFRDPRLARATAVLLLDEGRALVATDAPAVHVLDLASATLGSARRVPATLRALARAGSAIVAVGDDGAAVRIEGETITPMETGVTTDLGVLAPLGPDRWVAGGAAGTLVVLGGPATRALPHLAAVPVVDVAVRDGVIFGLLALGSVLRAEGDVVTGRPSRLANASRLPIRFEPDPAAPALAPIEPFDVAVDDATAVAPWGAIRERVTGTSAPFGTAPAIAAARNGGARDVPFRYDASPFGGSYCCDVDYAPTESAEILAALEPHDDPGDLDELFQHDVAQRLVSLAGQTAIAIIRTDCETTVSVRQLRTGRAVGERTFGCADGSAARDLAILEHLATLGVDATWEPPAGVDGLPELPAPVGGFFAREARGRVEIVMVDPTNRRATVLARLPAGAPAIGARRVPVTWRVAATPTGDGWDESDGAFSLFVGDGVLWMGPTPAALLRGEAEAEERDPTCADVVVTDADGETTLRLGPTSRSDAVARLPNGTRAHVARREGRWIAIDRPRSGWLFDANVTCAD